MTDILIILLFAGLAVFGIVHTLRHFRGQGGCCGSGGYTPKRKKLKNVLYTRTFSVSGMHCAHCRNRVEEVVNDMRGLSGRVDLKKGELTVSYAEDVEDSRIVERIQKAGYTVIGRKDGET